MCISTVKLQTDGFFSMRLGAFIVTALSDGEFDLPAATLLIEQQRGLVGDLLARARLPPVVCSTVNAYLIDTGTTRILIDAGAGMLQGAGLGKLLNRLRAAGHAPADVDLILLTHLHPDHVGGITQERRAVFPRASVRADARETAFWCDHANAASVDESVQAAFDGAIASLKPYQESGRFSSFQPGEALAPGIMAVALEGHTVGHTGFRLSSEGQHMLVCGDVLHVAAVQLAAPAVAIHYDSEPGRASRTRVRLFAEAAAQEYWLAAAHAPFPGIGRLKRAGDGYEWVPASAEPC